MTDQQISRSLALAIGWRVALIGTDSDDKEYTIVRDGKQWRLFDFSDPAVIWPIAERYNRFPYALRYRSGAFTGKWNILTDGVDYSADSAAKAVALAVIGRGK